MSRSLDFLYSGTTSVSGLQIDCDYLVVTKTIETQLLAWHSDWVNHRRYAHPFLFCGGLIGPSPSSLHPGESWCECY